MIIGRNEREMIVSRSKAKFICIIFTLLFLSWIIAQHTSDPYIYALIDIVWCGVMAIYIVVQTSSFNMSQDGKLIVLAGFLVRIGLAWWGTYGTGSLAVWLQAGDQGAFLDVAMQYYSGDFSENVTRYPYVLCAIFQIMGPNRIMPQMLNILCWFLGIQILLGVTNGLHGRMKILVLLFYTFLPYALLISTQVMRESAINLFSMLCFFFLLEWMKSGEKKHLIIMFAISLFPILLHTGNIALLIAAFLIYIQWDCETGRWRKSGLRWFILFSCFLIAIPLYESISTFFPMEYLPGKISLETITGKYFESGRSDYVSSVAVHTIGEFIFWSIYRMIYFWISPTPRFWNSSVDIIGFLFDSVPMFFIFIQIFKNIRREKRYSKSLAGLYILLAYTIIYAWGTANAGTAMRHRDQFLGIMVMSVLVGAKGNEYE